MTSAIRIHAHHMRDKENIKKEIIAGTLKIMRMEVSCFSL